MLNKLINYLVLLVFLLSTACSATPERSGDAEPLRNDVPTQTAEDDSGASGGPTDQGQVSTDPQPKNAENSAMIEFSVTGGIAALCDDFVVSHDGSYTISRPCDDYEKSGTLEQAELNSLRAWSENLADFQLTFEDNPGGPDNMIRALTFGGQGEVEADDRQKQVIFDWVNGLMVRLNTQDIELPPTPESNVLSSGGLCPDIPRPAVITIDVENPNMLYFVDPNTQDSCDIVLDRLPIGRMTAVAESLYYPVYNPEADSVAILQISADGRQTPLEFTEISAAEEGPADFVVSSGGEKIAWSQTEINPEADSPVYTNTLRLANTDGSEPVTILDQAQIDEARFVALIGFSADDNSLYYALQPDIGEPAPNGRFDTVYRVSVDGGEPELVYACPAEEGKSFCVTGVALDGTVLTVIEPDEDALQIIDSAGNLIKTMPLPATDYVGRTIFSPSGDLAFYTATLTPAGEEEPPLPEPGIVTRLATPYTGEPETLLSNNKVGTLWGWLDENRLVYGLIDEEGQQATALVTTEGETTELSPNFVVGVSR